MLSAGNLIEISSVIFEIWPGKFKSRGAGAFIQANVFIQRNTVDLERGECLPVAR